MVVVREQVAVELPAWQRERVPVEELCQWVQAAGGQVGLDRPGLNLLGNAVDAYGWELEAVWSMEQLYWSMQRRMYEAALGWYESVVRVLGAAERCWDSVMYWAERRTEQAMMSQLGWVAQRKQQLGNERQEFCRECAAFCEQQRLALPEWLQVALGLVPAPQDREEEWQ